MVEFLYAPITPAPDAWGDFSLISSDPGSSGFATYDAAGIPPAGMPDGHYLFAVRATDRAGNESLLLTGNPATYVAGVTQEVVIDNAAPTGSITAPAAGTVTTTTPAFTANASDALSGVKQVVFQYSEDDGSPNWITLSTDTAAPYQALWDGGLTDGTDYLLRAVITDRLGNEFVTPTVAVTVTLPL